MITLDDKDDVKDYNYNQNQNHIGNEEDNDDEGNED